jgi:hypothetical protein
MDIRHKRHGNPGGQQSQNLGGFNIRNGKTKQAAPHIPEAPDTFRYRFAAFPFQLGINQGILPHGLDNHRMRSSRQNGFDMIKPADFYGSRSAPTHTNGF